MSDCKHPKEFVSVLGAFKVCNICGERLPITPVKEATPKEEKPKEESKPKEELKKKAK